MNVLEHVCWYPFRRNINLRCNVLAKYYQPENNELLETEDLIVIGEDPGALNDGQKPTRILHNFAFFDPTRDLVMVSLSHLDGRRGNDDDDHTFEGAGEVTSVPENDEDEGQEDDLEDDDPQLIRIKNILGYSIDYTEDEEWVMFFFGFTQ
jgi:DNA (cytosine-5)-methyltransferase 1